MTAPRAPLSRLVDALASLRLGVVVMLALGLICGWATFYESSHGTPAVQRDVYQTTWFALLLALLGVNISCAMMARYPWKKHHAGFVMAHVGILVLLAGSLVSLHYGLDSNMALYEGETSDRVSLLSKALAAALPGHAAHGEFPADLEKDPPRPGHERRYGIPASDVTLVAEDFLRHASVQESFAEGSGGVPALHFVLESAFGSQDAWLVASDAERNHASFGPASVGFQTSGEAVDAGERHAGENHLSLVLTPAGRLAYSLSTTRGPGAAGAVKVGEPIETPWMGIKVTVDRFLAKALTRRVVAAAPLPAKDERRVPAVKLRLEGPSGSSPSEWVLWSESREVPFAGGTATLAYRSPEAAVPFRVTLLKFNSDKYPGSSMPATYESWVKVDDPERGVSEHHISMNNPLHYRGYIFFQASFVEGQPMMSIFSVTRAPGLPLVYLGVTLISLGVVWMFYLKPYLVRLQAARAVEARVHGMPRQDSVPRRARVRA